MDALARDWKRAATDVQLAFSRLSLVFKAGFDPEQPRDAQGRWAAVGQLVEKLGRGSVKAALLIARMHPAVRTITTALWLAEHIPYVEAYRADARTLEQLQADATMRRTGYDIHHIVEQTAARRMGFPEEMINDPSNLVSISTFKHWEVTAWYSAGNDEFNGLSPREYLKDKTWEERTSVGIDALKIAGVLK